MSALKAIAAPISAFNLRVSCSTAAWVRFDTMAADSAIGCMMSAFSSW